ncbi:MAG: ribosome-associated translation inhibitor RaiA [Myxococcaceae bacterium]|nr:ribosome-associated translation inhibitor RaiA [Myxococcaceae bacterium]
MQLSITFRHMDASDFLKDYAKEKVERVNKYLDRAGDAHVTLSLERHLHNADIVIHSGSWVLRGREKSEDMYASIDLAMDKIERQLRRYKDKLKNHHSHRYEHHQEQVLQQLRIRHNVIALDEPSEHDEAAPSAEPAAPRIVKSNELLARVLRVEDAIMQMNLMNNDFLVFTNAETKVMNVVYRRKDGHYGLIEANSNQ